MIYAPRPHRAALLAAAVSVLLAAPALAQTSMPPRPAQTAPSDPVGDLLRSKGERYHRAPDSAQDPDELRRTQALNEEIVAQNNLAENEDRANAAAHAQALARYQAGMEAAEADRQRYDAEARAAAEGQARYEQQMADWRATVAACERGDRARCNAGSQAPGPYRPY
ncbi:MULTISPECIES: cell wall hydrolase [unclassified Brevundimonas]|uniref:cell wall hydrolase n=1 Tax=unclassified Brevundimonas TaxID=2622653 RepID=UPI003F939BD8